MKQDDFTKKTKHILYNLINKYHFQSIGELNVLLEPYQLRAKLIKKEKNGKFYDGILYMLVNEKGECIGPHISGSDAGRGRGIAAIQSKMRKSKPYIKEKLPNIKHKIKKILLTLTSNNEKELIKALKEKQISLVLRKNEQGRIYGVTFIDKKQGIVLNGSRLGKEFSANMFNAFLNANKENIKWGSMEHNESMTNLSHTEERQTPQQDIHNNDSDSSHLEETQDSSGDWLDNIEYSNSFPIDDYENAKYEREEERFHQNLRWASRRKRGRKLR